MTNNPPLRVNEIFETFQGEGHWTGTPATFIRLQGCGVACPWCDTKHTWSSLPKHRISIDEMLRKVEPARSWAEMTAEQIAEIAGSMTPRHFVITGGEPCEQPIRPMLRALARLGRVQVETSGTEPIEADAGVWVTVSPKIAMPGRRKVRDEALTRADEIKMPVAMPDDIAALEGLLRTAKALVTAQIWLQPVSQDDSATRLCMYACSVRNWRLSLQTHKYAGIR